MEQEKEDQQGKEQGPKNEEAVRALEGVIVDDFEPGPDDIEGGKEKAPEIETSNILLMVIGPLADILAPGWNITETEKQMLAEAYAPVIDKYWPDMNMGPEFTAIAVTGVVFAPRLGQSRQDEEGGEDGDQPKDQPTK